MTIELMIRILIPVTGSLLTLLVGYFVFRNDQKNKNLAINMKFKALSKDIIKNDLRLREEFKNQNERNNKMFSRLEKNLEIIKDRQVQDGNDMIVTKTTLDYMTKTMAGMSSKLDLIVDKLIRTNS